MQRKLLAVAVAGALGAPTVAFAQSSTVQIFGTAYIEYSYARQGLAPNQAAAPINDRQNIDFLQNPGSEIGFKGEEKLGGGLSAWFQCTATMNFRGAGSANGGETDGLLCSRNSALGLKGGFGNVWIGRWDTPFKRTISPTNVAGNDTGIWGTAFLLTGGSTSTMPGTARATFKRREGNSIFYDSPTFGGFQVMAHFSAGNGQGAAGTGTTATTGVTGSKPRTMGIGAQYSAGPLYVSAGYEKHRQTANFASAAVTGGAQDDHGWHVGAAYTWGPVRFGGQYTEQKFDISGAGAAAGAVLGTPAGGATDAKYRAFHLGADWKIVGPHGLRVAYTRALDARGNATIIGAATGTNALLGGTYRPAPCFGTTAAAAAANCGSNTAAWLGQIRYVYTFSKRTEFNFGYVKLHNDSNAAYALGGLSTPQVGQSASAFALSLRHTF
jgi:predicted porin